MFESLRKLARAGLGAVSPERAEEIARSVVDQSQALLSRVGGEVRKRMRTAGIVTKEELSELKRRVRQLEREVGKHQAASSSDAAAPARKTPASGAKKSTAGPAEKAAARRGAARRPRP